MENIEKDLQTRRAEREALLQQIIRLLDMDECVVAAWLYGSLGRNDADALSDIDVHVVVADAHIHNLNADRHAYVARIGSPILIQDAPQNAPLGGAYLLVMYEGSVGPIQVDWTWQPESQAHLPSDVRVLFNRAQLAPESPIHPNGQALADELTNRAVFFWMMIQIAGKKIARQELWATLIVLNHVQQTLDTIKWLLNLTMKSPFPENRRTSRPPNTPSELITTVYSLADEMATLTPQIISFGGKVPIEVIEPTFRFLALIDSLVAMNKPMVGE